jgi:putative alpha-1,2-mannosidase
MAQQPWKAADRVRQTLSELYHADPDGLSGNEDVGQMSAWYILSALGFYQVEPAGGEYWFGSPIVDKAEIKVKGGVFTINVNGNSDSNRYIQSISLNGAPYTKGYICHDDIAAGGEMTIEMGSEPCLWY